MAEMRSDAHNRQVLASLHAEAGDGGGQIGPRCVRNDGDFNYNAAHLINLAKNTEGRAHTRGLSHLSRGDQSHLHKRIAHEPVAWLIEEGSDTGVQRIDGPHQTHAITCIALKAEVQLMEH